MPTFDPSAADAALAESRPAEPRRPGLLLNWKLWLGMLFIALAAIAFVIGLPIYRRMQALEYFDAHQITYELTDENEWATERLGRWGRGLRRVRSLGPMIIDDNVVVAHIAEFHEMQEFHCFGGVPLSEQSVATLTSLTHIEKLTLGNANFTDELLARWFDSRPPLRRVTLVRSAISHHGLRALSHIESLESVELFGTSLTDADFCDLEVLPHVQMLRISEGTLGSNAAQWISRMSALCTLHIDHANVTPEFWSNLTGMSCLETLACQDATIPAAGLEVISRFSAVIELNFENSLLDDGGLEHISRMSRLVDLALMHSTGISDTGVRHLEGMPSLRRLYLPAELMTPACIESLQNIPNLEGAVVGRSYYRSEELKALRLEE